VRKNVDFPFKVNGYPYPEGYDKIPEDEEKTAG
jgi:hypothetical protein